MHPCFPLSLQLLHAITATVWRNLDAVQARPLSNVLYGFGLLNFHPGARLLGWLCVLSARLPLCSRFGAMHKQSGGTRVWLVELQVVWS